MKTVNSNRILYTPSEFAKESLFYLQETGTSQSLKAHRNSRSLLNSYLFFVILAGDGQVTYKGEKHFLSKGDCVFLDCMEAYSQETFSNPWKIQWIHFNSNSMVGIYEKYIQRGGSSIFHPHNIDTYISLLDRIYLIASSDDNIRDMRLNSTIAELLTKIMELSWVPENQEIIKRGAKSVSLKEIKDYIDTNWNKIISLSDLEEKFFINKCYILRIFKNQYGRPVISYINEKRITHSKRLLRFSNESIEMIAYKCGFDDANYFSRKFKSLEGMTPGEFRKSWSQ